MPQGSLLQGSASTQTGLRGFPIRILRLNHVINNCLSQFYCPRFKEIHVGKSVDGLMLSSEQNYEKIENTTILRF